MSEFGDFNSPIRLAPETHEKINNGNSSESETIDDTFNYHKSTNRFKSSFNNSYDSKGVNSFPVFDGDYRNSKSPNTRIFSRKQLEVNIDRNHNHESPPITPYNYPTSSHYSVSPIGKNETKTYINYPSQGSEFLANDINSRKNQVSHKIIPHGLDPATILTETTIYTTTKLVRNDDAEDTLNLKTLQSNQRKPHDNLINSGPNFSTLPSVSRFENNTMSMDGGHYSGANLNFPAPMEPLSFNCRQCNDFQQLRLATLLAKSLPFVGGCMCCCRCNSMKSVGCRLHTCYEQNSDQDEIDIEPQPDPNEMSQRSTLSKTSHKCLCYNANFCHANCRQIQSCSNCHCNSAISNIAHCCHCGRNYDTLKKPTNQEKNKISNPFTT